MATRVTAATHQSVTDGVYIVYMHYLKVSWDDEDEVDAPSFPVLVEAIEKTIGQLGGAVFPKLNWSSPRVIQPLFSYIMLLVNITAGCYMGCHGEHFEVYMSFRCHSIAEELGLYNA